MESEKNKRILINKFDVLYRDIQNIDYQYALMSAILNRFNEKQLKSLIKSAKLTIKLEKEEQ
jgi:hypothetical protein|tara:strand:+ start:957 stop:1142 length:186 start_codon:yes stop_codon:yes gene_type:complete